jgi:hypothetical protein
MKLSKARRRDDEVVVHICLLSGLLVTLLAFAAAIVG